MGEWPKDKMLRHGPELPMEERIRRYQHNIRTVDFRRELTRD